MIGKLRIFLQNNWIFVSVAITVIPLSVKVIQELVKIDYIISNTYVVSKKMEPLLPKIDTLIKNQNIVLVNQQQLKSSIDSNRFEIKVYGSILKRHVIKESKTKEDLLNAIKNFGPYWNVNYNPDSSKKKLCLQWVK
jgi:hypothetical protein